MPNDRCFCNHPFSSPYGLPQYVSEISGKGNHHTYCIWTSLACVQINKNGLFYSLFCFARVALHFCNLHICFPALTNDNGSSRMQRTQYSLKCIFFFLWGNLLLKGRNLNQLLKIENRFIIKFSSSDTGGIHKCNTGKELRVGKSTASNPLQNSWLNCEKKNSDLRICIFASSIK